MLVLLMGSFYAAPAQDREETSDEIREIQRVWRDNKRDLVRKYMKLTPAEETSFWSVYLRYESEQDVLNKLRVAFQQDYVMNVGKMDNNKAHELTDKMFMVETLINKLQRKYYHDLTEVLPATRAAQYIQFENFIYTSMRFETQEKLPLMGSVPKKMRRR